MHVRARRVRVTDLEGGGDRWGVLVEADDGRALLALSAATPEELAVQLEEAGGAVGLARRRGFLPLDPVGLAVGEGDAPIWVPPTGT